MNRAWHRCLWPRVQECGNCWQGQLCPWRVSPPLHKGSSQLKNLTLCFVTFENLLFPFPPPQPGGYLEGSAEVVLNTYGIGVEERELTLESSMVIGGSSGWTGTVHRGGCFWWETSGSLVVLPRRHRLASRDSRTRTTTGLMVVG